MSRGIRGSLVAVLVLLYPAAWRSEYGAELTDILLARPLGPRVIADVLWNGLWLRARAAEPSTILGLVSILIVLAGFALGGGTFGRTWKILPAARVSFLFGGLFALLHFICGFWTYLRHGKLSLSGWASMRTSLITGIPIVIAALLMLLGLVEVRLPDTTHIPPSPVAMLIAPLVRLPDAWLWGALGGLLGKRITCGRQKDGVTQP